MALSNTLTRRLIYHGLRSLGRWQVLLERRLTQLGRFTLAAGFTAGVFGIDTRINLLYQAFAFTAALLLVSGLSVFYSELRLRRRFRATRSLPRYASVDAPISYLVAIGAQEQELLRGFFIEEQLPDPHPSLETFLYTDLADDSGANRFDQAIGYPRWQGLTRLGRWAEKPTIQPLSAPLEQGEMTERIALRPLRRGYLRLSGLLLSRPDPLGLLRTNLRLSCEQSLLVLPRRYPVPPFSLPGRRQYQPGGVTLASSIGDSQEFMGLREYRSGDSPRNIHWPSWARSGKPQIKEYQDEFFTRHALILDTFTDQSFDPCFESAISVAASLCESMQDGDSLLDLMFVGTRAYCFTGGRGLAGTEQFLEILACAQACTDRSFEQLQQVVLQRTTLLSAAVCILLDFDEPRRTMVRGLKAAGLPLKVLLVTGDGEAERLLGGWDDEKPLHICTTRIAADLANL